MSNKKEMDAIYNALDVVEKEIYTQGRNETEEAMKAEIRVLLDEYDKKIDEAKEQGNKDLEKFYIKQAGKIIVKFLPLKERALLMKQFTKASIKHARIARNDKNRRFSRKVLKGLSVEKRLEVLKNEYSKNPPLTSIGKRMAAMEINALSYLAIQKEIKAQREEYIGKATAENEVEYYSNIEKINRQIEEGEQEKVDIDNEMKKLAEQMKNLSIQREMVENSQTLQREAKVKEDEKINMARKNAKDAFDNQLAKTKPSFFERVRYFLGEKITKFNMWRKDRKQIKTYENQERLNRAINRKAPKFGEDFYQKVDAEKAARYAEQNKEEKEIKQL